MRRDVTAAEAQRLILEASSPLASETVAFSDALSRVLAEPIVAGRELPPADNSAMDGYAVRAADLAGAAAGRPVRLRVTFEVAAGAAPDREVGAGEAARILTGAPLPPGADSVVRQEDTSRDGESVLVRVVPRLRDNVRERGEDVRTGDRVLEPGALIGPAEVGMLAALGRVLVSVRRRPRVAILSGGDELVEPDGDVSGGRIVASNSYSVAAQCREIGAEPVYLGIARDDPADLERRFRAGLRADLLISSAGVSVGDRDYVRPVLEKLGCTLVFWGVKIKPGFPLVFGRFEDGPLVFGLPGNPVSAMVTFEQFVRPALLKMSGHPVWFRPLLRATLAERLQKSAGRLHFVRVELERKGDQVLARSTGTQSSGALRSMTLASGLLIFPAEQTVLNPGDSASVQVLDPGFFAASEPGF
ncbi:MAG TPA: gephyrin-like molybdotransferase Glp [Candidatus Limnocylindrales bacterium]